MFCFMLGNGNPVSHAHHGQLGLNHEVHLYLLFAVNADEVRNLGIILNIEPKIIAKRNNSHYQCGQP